MKARTHLFLILAAALTLSLPACGAMQGASYSGASDPEVAAVAPGELGDGSAELIDEQAVASTPAEIGASVIQNGWISIRVDDLAASADEIVATAERLDGYAENVSVEGTENREASYADITLRVPADRFDELFDELGLIGNASSEGRSATDVTTQHVDLKARVAALEGSVDRLTDLMSGAATTSELIEAESALSERQQELDGLRAQLEAIESQVDFSTIQVSLNSGSTIPGGPTDFWDGILTGVQSIATAGAGALIVFGVLLPWLVLVGIVAIVVALIVRAARGSRRRRHDQAKRSAEASSNADTDEVRATSDE